MPGAPNRPPEIDGPPPPAAPADQSARRVVRRLGAMRVALRLDLWKGAPSAELVTPLERAEASFASGDLLTSLGHTDQLAIRFAEPRWPTLPVPFKGLRQGIPAPQPPQWDPEFTLTPPEKELRRLRREAELYVDLAAATISWGASHSVDLSDLVAPLEQTRALLAATGPDDAFWAESDLFWQAVRARVPMPKGPAGRPAPAAAPSEAAEPA